MSRGWMLAVAVAALAVAGCGNRWESARAEEPKKPEETAMPLTPSRLPAAKQGLDPLFWGDRTVLCLDDGKGWLGGGKGEAVELPAGMAVLAAQLKERASELRGEALASGQVWTGMLLVAAAPQASFDAVCAAIAASMTAGGFSQATVVASGDEGRAGAVPLDIPALDQPAAQPPAEAAHKEEQARKVEETVKRVPVLGLVGTGDETGPNSGSEAQEGQAGEGTGTACPAVVTLAVSGVSVALGGRTAAGAIREDERGVAGAVPRLAGSLAASLRTEPMEQVCRLDLTVQGSLSWGDAISAAAAVRHAFRLEQEAHPGTPKMPRVRLLWGQ